MYAAMAALFVGGFAYLQLDLIKDVLGLGSGKTEQQVISDKVDKVMKEKLPQVLSLSGIMTMK